MGCIAKLGGATLHYHNRNHHVLKVACFTLFAFLWECKETSFSAASVTRTVMVKSWATRRLAWAETAAKNIDHG